jgi:hypothetical protein
MYYPLLPSSMRTPKLQKKPSILKREHPALQNMIFLNFFLLLWVIFALLDPDADPDPLTRLNPDLIRIGIRKPVKKERRTMGCFQIGEIDTVCGNFLYLTEGTNLSLIKLEY